MLPSTTLLEEDGFTVTFFPVLFHSVTWPPTDLTMDACACCRSASDQISVSSISLEASDTIVSRGRVGRFGDGSKNAVA